MTPDDPGFSVGIITPMPWSKIDEYLYGSEYDEVENEITT